MGKHVKSRGYCSVIRQLSALSSGPAVWALAGAAAVGGALAPDAPTGVGGFDLVLRAGFCLCLTLLASRARRWAWVTAAAVAVVGSYDEGWVALGLVALGLGVGSLLVDEAATGTVLGALIGACVSQAVLRLSWSPVLGVSAILATLATLALVVGWLRHSRCPPRRWLGRATLGLGVAVMLATVLAGAATLRARSSAEAGLAEAEAGLAAAQSEHGGSVLADLQASAGLLAESHREMTEWWARPGYLVPLVSQNERAVSSLTLQGTTVARSAVALVRSATTSGTHQSAGSVDLAKLTTLGPSVDASLKSLHRAESALRATHSPWLLAPIRSHLNELSTKISSFKADEVEVAQAVKILPDLLGKAGPQRYLVMVQDPSEDRASGGLIADQAIVTADNGHLSLGDFGVVGVPSAKDPPLEVDQATQSWAESEDFNLTTSPEDDSFSPDFPTDARVFEQSETQLGSPAVDGVISVDPTVLQAILSVTGPVTVSGWPVPLSATNVLPILLHDQYVSLQGHARQAFLASATGTIFHIFTHTSLAKPIALAHALGTSIKSEHLLVYANAPAVERSLQALGVGGAMPAVDGDFLEVVTQNHTTNKIDWFLRRSYKYKVHYDPATGVVDATLAITLTNNAPASGEPAYVIGRNPGSPVPAGAADELVTVYSPLGILDAKQDGRTAMVGSEVVEGRHAYSVFVPIPSKSSTEVTLELKGTLTSQTGYHLEVADQPSVAPSQAKVSVTPPPPWETSGSSTMTLKPARATWSGPVSNDRKLSVSFYRSG